MSEQFPSNELEAGLVAASKGERTLGSWLADLARSRMWVPLEDTDNAEGGTFRLITVEDRQYVPVFTSRHQLETVLGPVPMANPEADDFVGYVPGNVGLAINPGGDLGLPLEPDAVQMLRQPPRTVDAGTSVFLGEPAVEPVQLLAQVADGLRHVPEVRAARRCWAVVGSQQPGLVLSVDMAPDTDSLREEVAKAVATTVEDDAPGYSVDLVFDADGTEFTVWMLANAAPFFTALGSPVEQ